jgi:hypothetical protein
VDASEYPHGSNGQRLQDFYSKKIRQKLEFYNKAVPEVQFMYMSNGKAWYESLQGLELVLGYQSTNLDYEHPSDLRETLLFATIEKIKTMLIKKVVSSYLFKVGQQAGIKRKYACIITLDPGTTIASNLIATRHMLDLPDQEFKFIPKNNYIDSNDHLDFILDHEVYHCLDTFYYGGIKMSKKKFWGKYSCYNRERQADMFAIAMHIYRKGEDSPYVQKIRQLRGMTLINGEVQHNSDEGIKIISGIGSSQLVWEKIRDLVEIVKNLDKVLFPTYEQYLDYRLSAIEAIKRLGRTLYEVDEPVVPKGRILDKKAVQDLVEKSKRYYQEFVGVKYRAK